MNNDVIKTIKKEVAKHEKNIDVLHIDTIARLIYKHLLEYIPEEGIEKLVINMQSEFLTIVDILIPVVEEYESKLDKVLSDYISTVSNKF